MKEKIVLLGVYETDEDDVYLLELEIGEKPSAVDLSEFALKEEDLPEGDWQVPYDEKYLDETGSRVIGEFFDKNQLGGAFTRVVFFLYTEDLSLPLLTPYGELSLEQPTEMPERLKKIITFLPLD